jgi:hypothetical protein
MDVSVPSGLRKEVTVGPVVFEEKEHNPNVIYF